jgi:hypothetical protein
MHSRLLIPAFLPRFLVLVGCIALSSCQSRHSAPAIAFSKVPAAFQEGPYNTDIIEERDYKRDTIEGRATGVRAGQRLVLYAKTDGRWGVCLQSGQPFTNIGPDGAWKATVHLGIQYAGLLVDPTYTPPIQTEVLPGIGNGVAEVAIVDGQGPGVVLPSSKTLKFSGYQWTTSSGPIFHAGSRNFFDPANVWTDDKGALHLRIAGSPGKWSSAELKLTRSLGYGTYRFQVRDASHLEPSAVLTFITWDGVGTESNRRELDIELSRWGYVNNTNLDYVVQPYYVPANFVAFRAPPGPYTHSFRWEPGKATFSTVASTGSADDGRVVNQHVFTSGVPAPGGESVRISLYVFHQGESRKVLPSVPLTNENEVVIDKFEYLP